MTKLTSLGSLLQEVMTGNMKSKLSNTTKPQFLNSLLQEGVGYVCYVCMFKGFFLLINTNIEHFVNKGISCSCEFT